MQNVAEDVVTEMGKFAKVKERTRTSPKSNVLAFVNFPKACMMFQLL